MLSFFLLLDEQGIMAGLQIVEGEPATALTTVIPTGLTDYFTVSYDEVLILHVVVVLQLSCCHFSCIVRWK
ncbi:hypothetical protein D3C84_1104400 [compost metagenome]